MNQSSPIAGDTQKFVLPYFSTWLPWLVLAGSLAGTYQLWQYAQQEAIAKLQTRFDYRVLDTVSHITRHLQTYEQVLQGVQGLYSSSESVEREEFRSYIDAMRLPENYPGFQSVQYLQFVPAAQKTRYLDAMHKAGFPQFAIRPGGNRDTYCPVTYVEPFTTTNQSTLGLDTCAEAKRSTAKNQARDTGTATLTGKTILSTESSASPQAGVVMVLPIYTNGRPHESLAERRANIAGWITATFRMDDLMDATIGDIPRNLGLEIAVYDGETLSDQTRLYGPNNNHRPGTNNEYPFAATKPIQIANRTWTISVHPSPEFSALLDKESLELVAFGGIGISLLLTLLTWLLVKGRARALKAAARMNKRLIASEARMNDAQRISHLGSWELDIVTGELLWSDEIFQLFEIDKSWFHATYEGFLNAIHPEDREAVNLAYTNSLKNRQPYEITHRLQMHDGRVKWVAERCITYFDTAGNPLRSVGTIQDITERKLSEEISRRHKLVIDTARDGFWVIDLEGNLLEANQAYADMSGYAVAELEKMHTSQLEAIEDQAAVQAHITKILAQGSDLFETRHRHRDGHEFDVEVSVNYMAESKQMFAFFRDISERKQAENELRVAATAFETHEAIMITDADANIVRVNRAFEKTTGYSADEVIGKNPRILSSGRHDKAFYVELWQTLLSTGAWSGEMWDRHKNGNIYPKQLTITSVKNREFRTTQYVAIFTDISERKQAEEEIHNLAFNDTLTGLPNRRLLFDRLSLALSLSARHRQYGALLFLDLDNFKTINDAFGHSHGDMLLVEVAHRLKYCVREVDTVARLGGDEFVVLIEGISEDAEETSRHIAQIAEKIRAVLAAPYQLRETTHHSSPSIGVCLFFGNQDSVDELVKRADMAMYQAKGSGRNKVQFFDPQMQQLVETRAALESDLRLAIAEQQFHLYYQVQMDQNHRPIGAEALIRWKHPRRGMVSPAQFIPIAEESSLILSIGTWVLESACRQLEAWRTDPRTRDLVLAINVSAQQFSQADFVEQVKAVLEKFSIEPSQLKLELTESVVLGDLDFVIAKMLALRHVLGVRLSLDDFGTGYSSLSYLKQLPLHQIKIDQSFVRDMTTDASDAVMVKTIIDMANNFNLHVIAEGVETEAQLDLLKQNGCQTYQGYLFSKPLPIEEFEALLQQPYSHS